LIYKAIVFDDSLIVKEETTAGKEDEIGKEEK
jgi:hypothetical protein